MAVPSSREVGTEHRLRIHVRAGTVKTTVGLQKLIVDVQGRRRRPCGGSPVVPWPVKRISGEVVPEQRSEAGKEVRLGI